MNRNRLFQGISEEEKLLLMECLMPEIRKYRRGDTILSNGQEYETIGILLSGKAHLYCIDSAGEYVFLEQYEADELMGEGLVSYANLGCMVEADCSCEVMMIQTAQFFSSCRCGCETHCRLLRNLYELSAEKKQETAVRISIVSQKTIRRKLTVYFQYMKDLNGEGFELKMSLSRLADYLCTDRSSMMRELKAMRDEGLIERSGRRIRLIRPLPVALGTEH